MIAYFDSFALVPLLVNEARSGSSETLWNSATRVAAARIAYPEVCAALAMAHRLDRIDETTRSDLLLRFNALWQQIDVVEITKSVAERAAEMAFDFGLRGHDAVYLAAAEVVAEPDAVFVCWDKDLSAAAESLGLNWTNSLCEDVGRNARRRKSEVRFSVTKRSSA